MPRRSRHSRCRPRSLPLTRPQRASRQGKGYAWRPSRPRRIGRGCARAIASGQLGTERAQRRADRARARSPAIADQPPVFEFSPTATSTVADRALTALGEVDVAISATNGKDGLKGNERNDLGGSPGRPVCAPGWRSQRGSQGGQRARRPDRCGRQEARSSSRGPAAEIRRGPRGDPRREALGPLLATWDDRKPMEVTVVAFALGLFLLALTYWDLFETVIVPRPTPGWFRIGRYLVRGSWRVHPQPSAMAGPADPTTGPGPVRAGRDDRPAGAWLVGLIVGYGLILYALRDQLRPVPTDLGGALYFAATSVLTLGFGDIVADGPPPASSSPSPRSAASARSPWWSPSCSRCTARTSDAKSRSSSSSQPPEGHPRRSPSSRPTPSWTSSIACRSCSTTGTAGRPRSSTHMSRTRCFATSDPATTTCPGSARSGRCSTPPAWS